MPGRLEYSQIFHFGLLLNLLDRFCFDCIPFFALSDLTGYLDHFPDHLGEIFSFDDIVSVIGLNHEILTILYYYSDNGFLR